MKSIKKEIKEIKGFPLAFKMADFKKSKENKLKSPVLKFIKINKNNTTLGNVSRHYKNIVRII